MIYDNEMSPSIKINVFYHSVTSQNLDNGAVAVNFSVGGGTNDQFDIQIINGTATLAGEHVYVNLVRNMLSRF